jgi:hypothetical protein
VSRKAINNRGVFLRIPAYLITKGPVSTHETTRMR